MKSTGLFVWFAAIAVRMLVASTTYSAEKNLGEVLRESGCDRIVGTWVDETTKGKSVTSIYKWRFENRVIEVASEFDAAKTVALMGQNAQTGDVFHLGADNRGGSSIGSWTFEDGEATLELAFVTGDGLEGGAMIRHRLKDENTMIVTIDAGESVTFTMIRTEPQDQEEAKGQ